MQGCCTRKGAAAFLFGIFRKPWYNKGQKAPWARRNPPTTKENYETRLQTCGKSQIYPYDLASELWHEVYKRYYPAKQLDTLVDTLQSADAIEEDIDNDVNYFLVLLGGKVIGYFAWKMENTSLHLLHLYLKPEFRGKALGRDIVASCERLARGEGRGRVWCTVHAKALPVQQFFKAKGYRLLGPAEEDETTRLPGQLIFERML